MGDYYKIFNYNVILFIKVNLSFSEIYSYPNQNISLFFFGEIHISTKFGSAYFQAYRTSDRKSVAIKMNKHKGNYTFCLDNLSNMEWY